LTLVPLVSAGVGSVTITRVRGAGDEGGRDPDMLALEASGDESGTKVSPQSWLVGVNVRLRSALPGFESSSLSVVRSAVLRRESSEAVELVDLADWRLAAAEPGQR
jgi:hypothetical protein